MNLLSLALLLPALLGVSAAPSQRQVCSLTWNGSNIAGTAEGNVCRYAIRYGTAARWTDAVATSAYGNTASVAPSCPQPGGAIAGASQSEDCLYLTLYVPSGASALPVLAWVHGGSYFFGSDAAPGLDGAKLASSSNIVVAEIHYRLGALGFLAPAQAPASADPNFGLRDIVLALNTLQARAGDYGGDGTKITLGGESTGASLIRALYGVPAAQGLFRSAILQSDPLNYGFASTATTTKVRANFFTSRVFAPYSASSLAAWQAYPLSTILAAQAATISSAPNFIAGVPHQQPIRPTYGTNTLPSDPTAAFFSDPSQLPVSPASTPLLITNTADEGAGVVASGLPGPVPLSQGTYANVLATILDPSRAATLSNPSGPYPLPSTDSGDTLRNTLSHVVSDGAWRCPARSLAANYAGAGGQVYVAEWTAGVKYPLNAGVSLCNGKVCHGDDIYPTFGTSPSPGALDAEANAAWGSFVNTQGISWNQFTSGSGVSGTDVHAIGGGAVGSCPDSYWGSQVQWNWQVYA